MESWAADDVTATLGEAKQRQFLRVIAAEQNSSREHENTLSQRSIWGPPIACLSGGGSPGLGKFPSGRRSSAPSGCLGTIIVCQSID